MKILRKSCISKNREINDKAAGSIRLRIFAWILKRVYHALYHQFAWSYDIVAAFVSLGQWKHWVVGSQSLVLGPAVLELGFGPGHLQDSLVKHGFKTYGLDESMHMARRAYHKLNKSRSQSDGTTTRAKLAQGLAQSIPFSEESFDTVIATFPTPYIFDPLTLDEVGRVIRSKGRFIVILTAWFEGSTFIEQIWKRIFRFALSTPSGHLDAMIHLSSTLWQAKVVEYTYKSSRVQALVADKRG